MSKLTPAASNRRLVRLLVPLAVASLTIAGCGDDDADDTASDTTEVAETTGETGGAGTDDTTDGSGASDGGGEGLEGASTEEFCAVVEEVNSADAPPTVELVERYLAVVPEEGRDSTIVLRDALEAAGGDFSAVLADPEAGAAMEALTALESEVCGTESGPAQDPAVQEIDPAATRVDMTFADYSFEGSAPTTAGRYSFVFTNEGAEAHIAILAQLEEGVTLEEAMASEGEEGIVVEFESSVAPPGAEAVITADLTPGEWVLVCPIPDAEGTPHVAHGMVTTFTVT